MEEVRSKVTIKGQVTIPVEIRRRLGLRPRDNVAFRVEGDQVRLARSGSVVEQTAGAFRTEAPALSAEQLRKVAEEAIAEEAIERMGT